MHATQRGTTPIEERDASAGGGEDEVLRAGGTASAVVRVVGTRDGTAIRSDFSRSGAFARLTVGALMAGREARACARLGGVPRLLARLRARGVLHGDVKRNALVTPAGGAAIVDFGASGTAGRGRA